MQPIAVRERVQMRDRSGIYLVVGIDQDREVADLIPVTGPETLEEDVPLAAIVPAEPLTADGCDHPKTT